MDLSFGATTVFGPAGLGGRYTAKARAFGGRTITTSLFANAFGGVDFSSGRLDLRWFQLNKNLQFPSGSVDSDKISRPLILDKSLFVTKDNAIIKLN